MKLGNNREDQVHTDTQNTPKEPRQPKQKKFKFNKVRKQEEQRLLELLTSTDPESEKYTKIQNKLINSSNIRKGERVTADNVLGALTSIGGLGMVVAYDQAHNVHKAAMPWVRKPGSTPAK